MNTFTVTVPNIGIRHLPVLTAEEVVMRVKRKIMAIKIYRERTNVSLIEAKCAIEQYVEYPTISDSDRELWEHIFQSVCVNLSSDMSLTPEQVASRSKAIAEEMLAARQLWEVQLDGLAKLSKI